MKNRILKLGMLLGTGGAILFTAACAAPAAGGTEPTGGFDYTTLILLGVMVVAFYFLMIRPQQKRSKQQKDLMENLKKGDKVITASGIFGVIDAVDDETLVIEVESGATMRVLKNSVMVKREVQ